MDSGSNSEPGLDQDEWDLAEEQFFLDCANNIDVNDEDVEEEEKLPVNDEEEKLPENDIS
jgi:hypothetical protein